MQIDTSAPDSIVKDVSDKDERKFYVYANLNMPREEDFTFLVTTLWHWYSKYPHASLQLVKDPAEIAQEPPKSIEKSKTMKINISQPKLLSDASQKI